MASAFAAEEAWLPTCFHPGPGLPSSHPLVAAVVGPRVVLFVQEEAVVVLADNKASVGLLPRDSSRHVGDVDLADRWPRQRDCSGMILTLG